jgi:hypothetical protein
LQVFGLADGSKGPGSVSALPVYLLDTQMAGLRDSMHGIASGWHFFFEDLGALLCRGRPSVGFVVGGYKARVFWGFVVYICKGSIMLNMLM